MAWDFDSLTKLVAVLFVLGFCCVVWFLFSLLRSRKRSQISAAILWLLFAGMFVWAVGSWMGRIAPPHIPRPQINVSYSPPRVSPDRQAIYFTKTVSQENKGMTYRVHGMFEG